MDTEEETPKKGNSTKVKEEEKSSEERESVKAKKEKKDSPKRKEDKTPDKEKKEKKSDKDKKEKKDKKKGILSSLCDYILLKDILLVIGFKIQNFLFFLFNPIILIIKYPLNCLSLKLSF